MMVRVAQLMRVQEVLVTKNQEVQLMQVRVVQLIKVRVVRVMKVRAVLATQVPVAVGIVLQSVLNVLLLNKKNLRTNFYKISFDSALKSGCDASRNHSNRTDSVFSNHTPACSSLISAVS